MRKSVVNSDKVNFTHLGELCPEIFRSVSRGTGGFAPERWATLIVLSASDESQPLETCGLLYLDCIPNVGYCGIFLPLWVYSLSILYTHDLYSSI